MESNGEIDMEDEVTKVSVSNVTIFSNALADFVSAWNFHRIPGRRGGIPNILPRATSWHNLHRIELECSLGLIYVAVLRCLRTGYARL